MNNKCCNCDYDKKSFNTTDYATIIERLVCARDEIDDLIQLLQNRQTKDKIINDILSSNYSNDEYNYDEATLRQILENYKLLSKRKTNVFYPFDMYR